MALTQGIQRGQPRGVGALRAHPHFCLTFIEIGHLPIHFLVLPNHFEEASYAAVSLKFQQIEKIVNYDSVIILILSYLFLSSCAKRVLSI